MTQTSLDCLYCWISDATNQGLPNFLVTCAVHSVMNENLVNKEQLYMGALLDGVVEMCKDLWMLDHFPAC